MAELVYAWVSKTHGGNPVSVRLRSPAPLTQEPFFAIIETMLDQDGDSGPTPGSPNPTSPTSFSTASISDNPSPSVPPLVGPPPTQPEPLDAPQTTLPSWAQPATIRAEAEAPSETAQPPAADNEPDPVEVPEQPLTAKQEETVETPEDVLSKLSSAQKKEDLALVADQLTNLYLDYRLKMSLAQEAKTEAWEEAAKKFPDYAQKITDLAQTLRASEKIKKESYPEADSLMQRINFHQVEDEASRMLLTDILWRRASNQSGKLDADLNLPEEATQMLKEMGVSAEDIRGEVELTPSEVMEQILSGKLRVIKVSKA